VVALALIPLSFALHLCVVAGDTGDVICAQRPEESKSLRLVIGDKSRNEFLFGEYRFNRMPLTLIAERDGVILYESSLIASNALSFAAVDRNQRSKSYRIQRSPPDFAKFPNQHYRLNDGDFLIRDINLCDGYWRIVEKLPTNTVAQLQVTAHFDTENADPMVPSSWTGSARSNEVSVNLELPCIQSLNAP